MYQILYQSGWGIFSLQHNKILALVWSDLIGEAFKTIFKDCLGFLHLLERFVHININKNKNKGYNLEEFTFL